MKLFTKLSNMKSPSATPRTINSVEFNFYPSRFGRVFSGQVKDILVPIVEAVQVFFRSKEADATITEDMAPDGSVIRQRQPATAEMVELRQSHDQARMKAATDTLFDPGTRQGLGLLIMDSLRDEVEEEPTEAQITEFIDQLDVPTFVEFLRGFIEANGKLFGDAGKALGARLKTGLSLVTDPEEVDSSEKPEPVSESEQSKSEASMMPTPETPPSTPPSESASN